MGRSDGAMGDDKSQLREPQRSGPELQRRLLQARGELLQPGLHRGRRHFRRENGDRGRSHQGHHQHGRQRPGLSGHDQLRQHVGPLSGRVGQRGHEEARPCGGAEREPDRRDKLSADQAGRVFERQVGGERELQDPE